MDRITGWDCGRVYYVHGEESGIWPYADRPSHECKKAMERLAAYEDTNRDPEQILELLQKVQQLTTDNAALEEVLAAKLAEIAGLEEAARLDGDGCEYCTIDSSTRKVLGYDGSGDGIGIVYGDGLAGIDADTWEIVTHFCPMCGRQLPDAPKGERDE